MDFNTLLRVVKVHAIEGEDEIIEVLTEFQKDEIEYSSLGGMVRLYETVVTEV